tara:strand:- start:177 stop:281 length:105 start_codon:yes stop_codon:yes gene_type:complete
MNKKSVEDKKLLILTISQKTLPPVEFLKISNRFY